mmetsp:Transcript_35580/g.113753  ORF Transcript_35580/g.113753 Transcript_35580/m.113753 type:complete len:125 (+) Transcript_35580:110-484(+)
MRQELLPGNEEEPRHGCCVRLLLVVAALFGSLAFIPTSLFWLGVFACLGCAKLCVYHCCCDDYGRVYMEAIVWTPCRWMRISCSGKGHVWPSDAAKAAWRKREADASSPRATRPPVGAVVVTGV